MTPNSICFLCTSIHYGGAEIQVLNLASILKKRGWEVKVVSMREPKELLNKYVENSITVISLNMAKGFPDPRAVIRMAAIIREWKPDVLHCHMFHANILGRIVRLFVSIPVVITTAHNIYEGARWREIAYRITDRLTDVTTNVSKTAVKRYIKVGAVPRERIKLVYNGLDVERFRPDKPAAIKIRKELELSSVFVWLAIGSMTEQKDYSNLLKAYKQINQEIYPTVLLIIGEGGIRNELEIMVAKYKLSNIVYFLGGRSDIDKIMNIADGYVMSSAWEGLPMVLLEASATGIPIVCTDVGGNTEIVQEGNTGFMVKPRKPKKLSESMTRLMELPLSERLRMGKNGRKYIIAKFSLENIVDKWEALYCELYSSKQISYKPE